MKKWDYKKLIKGIKEGDYNAFEALYMLYFGRFISFTERIIHDREAAKDLVQEQFMKIWLLRNHLDENKSIRNYLYVLTKRAILNYLRDLKKTERIDESKAGEELCQPGFDVDTQELLKSLFLKIDSLPEQEKKVMILSRKEGLSNKEIAERLGLSIRTVERHITLALKKMRNIVS